MNRRFFVAATAFWFAACTGNARSPSGSVHTRADLISLSPAITETLALLGAGDRLAGRSDWCAEPASVRTLPAFGTSLTPSLERLAAAAPARILIDGSVANQGEQLAAIAPVEVLPWLTVTEVIASIRKLGDLVGHPTEADALAARFEVWLRPVPAGAGAALLLIGDDGAETGTFWFVKDDSLHGAMLRAAGWRNAVSEPVTTPSLSAEGLLLLNPETIVLLVPRALSAEEQLRRIAAFSKFSAVRAVSSNRVAVVADPNILSTGPSLLTSGERLASTLRRWEAR